MKIAIMGTGGVGGYFGGLLARAGEDVTFIARGAHLAAIQSGGLRVESVHGDFHVSPAQATADPASIGPVDLVLVSTKTFQIEEAGEAMRPLVGPETVVVPLHNGVDSTERLAPILGGQNVIGGTCGISSLIAGPGLIRQVSPFRRIILGELDGSITPRVQAIGAVLERAEIETVVSDNIQRARWNKFIFIAPFSGVGAVTRVPMGEIVGCPETRALLESAMREVAALGVASGVSLKPDVVDTWLATCDSMVPDITASMQRDIMEGRPSEIESQNGYVARHGVELGVPVPVNTYLYGALLPQEKRARGG